MEQWLRSATILALLCILVAAVIGSGCADESRVVSFPDPNVELAIREALGKTEGDIYTSDLEKLTELTLGGLFMVTVPEKVITDITGLEYCNHLTRLVLMSNEISDISPLSSLTRLRELNLGGGQLGDITPLSRLTNLTKLHLDIISISDISPLANLTNLTELRLQNNKISDIKPLVDNSGLSEGDYLQLHGNPLSWQSRQVYIPQLEARGVRVHYQEDTPMKAEAVSRLLFTSKLSLGWYNLSLGHK